MLQSGRVSRETLGYFLRWWLAESCVIPVEDSGHPGPQGMTSGHLRKHETALDKILLMRGMGEGDLWGISCCHLMSVVSKLRVLNMAACSTVGWDIPLWTGTLPSKKSWLPLPWGLVRSSFVSLLYNLCFSSCFFSNLFVRQATLFYISLSWLQNLDL